MERLRIDPAHTALLVVDMQQAFTRDDTHIGKKYSSLEKLRATIPVIKKLVNLCRKKGIPVVFTKQVHLRKDASRESHKIIPPLSVFAMDKAGTLGCLEGGWDTEIVEDLEPTKDDYKVIKHRPSAFYKTNLDILLRARDVKTLVIVGLTANFCVESTIRDAYHRDYDIILVKEGTAAFDENLYNATIENTKRYFGAVVSIDEISTILERLLNVGA